MPPYPASCYLRNDEKNCRFQFNGFEQFRRELGKCSLLRGFKNTEAALQFPLLGRFFIGL